MDFVANSTPFLLLLVFLVALIESLAFIGLLVPGAFLLFSLSAIASQSSISVATLLATGFIGAFLGDNLSYRLGCKLEHRLSEWPWLRQHQTVIEQGHWYFNKWGGVSLIIGRLLGPLRPITPFVAGTMGMPQYRFIPLSLLSAMTWAPAYLLPGYYTGELHQLWQLQPLNDRSLIIYALSALAIIFVFVTIYHHTHPEALQLKGWLNKKQAEFWPIQALAICLLSGIALIMTIFWVPDEFNNTFNDGALLWQNYSLYPLWKLFDAGQQSVTAALSFACIALWLFAQMRWKILLALLITASLTIGVAILLHNTLNIADLRSTFLASTMITLLIGFLSIIHANRLKPNRRWQVYFASSLVVLVFSISHLWIGSLTLSTLMTSIWLGLMSASTAKLLWHFLAGPANFRNPWPTTILLVLTTVSCAFLYHKP